jgi:hypothetical protein
VDLPPVDGGREAEVITLYFIPNVCKRTTLHQAQGSEGEGQPAIDLARSALGAIFNRF